MSSDASLPSVPLLRESALRGLIAAKAAIVVAAVGVSGGFIVTISLGGGKVALASVRGGQRLFASLSTLAGLLARLGCHHFQVDTTGYQPGRIRPAQPERSASMKAGRLPKSPKVSKKP